MLCAADGTSEKPNRHNASSSKIETSRGPVKCCGQYPPPSRVMLIECDSCEMISDLLAELHVICSLIVIYVILSL